MWWARHRRAGVAVAMVSTLMALWVNGLNAAEQEEAPLRKVTVDVDLGKDLGQNLGSLFEARDAAGRVVFGAGFQGVYNTMFRGDPHVLQVFARPIVERSTPAEFVPLPRPSPDSGTYLFDLDGKLYSFPYTNERIVRSWDPALGAWQVEKGPEGDKQTWGFAWTRVGDGVLRMGIGGADYNGTKILTPPAQGEYNFFYYAQGHIIFYHTLRAEQGGFTKVVACPWQPGDGPVDMSVAPSLQVRFTGETPFAFGQFRGKVLTCSNRGGIYVFDGKNWSVLQQPYETGSFQVYSMINYYDTFLMAQYPSGELFEYDGARLRQLKGWPPHLQGVSTSSREAQTTAIYGGDLFVGVWPWGELWRYDHDAKAWSFMGRLFKHPALTDKYTHPYEAECVAAKIVANDWGQRVPAMTPLGDSLYLSTSSKGAWKAPTFDWMPEESRQEYGRVLRLTLPGQLAAPIRWKTGTTRFQFVIRKDRMTVLQDNVVLGETKLSEGQADRISKSAVTWGRGVFGPFQGKLVSQAEQ
jgi:hypothetical protein